MNYSNDFIELINTCIKQNQFLGLGNPNAKILFIGKEAGSPLNSEIYNGNGKSWKENEYDYSKRYMPEEKSLQNLRHTWQRYQKLFEKIFKSLNFIESLSKQKYEITFVENIFTTELSNLPAPKTSEAKKQSDFKTNLAKRKEIFWTNKFIKQFPIVIITANDNNYIETFPGEVCKIFDVKFSKEIICGKSGKIWVHYANEKENMVYPKLVIHTRQLTNGASDELLNTIADIVVDFVKKHNINVKIK